MHRAVVMQPIRHPLEVARSLARRNGIPLCAGIALWDRYNRAAATLSRDCPRVTVDYARLVADPATECARLGERLSEAGFGGLDAAAGAARVDPDLHREREADVEQCDFVGPPQLALWRAVIAGDTDALASACSPTVVEALRAYERDVDAWREIEAEVRQLRAQPPVAPADTAALEATRAALGRERARVADLLASRSWRLTAPLRAGGDLLRRLRRR